LREDATSVEGSRRRIHVTLLAPGGFVVDVPTLTFSQATGELLTASVAIDTTLPISVGAWLTIAGKLLGFQHTSAVDSVLNEEISTPTRTALTDADLQSVATVYPACR